MSWLTRRRCAALFETTASATVSDGWWNANGAFSLTWVIAAYQAKGATSYAASKQNLVSPGVHDLIEVSAPVWNAGVGWTFTYWLNQYFKTDIWPPSGCSAFVRYSGPTANTHNPGCVLGCYDPGTAIPRVGYGLFPLFSSNTDIYTGLYADHITSPSSNTGVMGWSGNTGWLNGAQIITGDVAGALPVGPLYIGAINYNNGGMESPWGDNIQAVVIIDRAITGHEAALTAAMNAL